MNLLEKLMSIINKQKQAILFSQKDKEIIREISQCNNSYYKTKVLDVLQCELSDWMNILMRQSRLSSLD